MNDEYEHDDNPADAIVELLGLRNRLTEERNQARAIAALLEADAIVELLGLTNRLTEERNQARAIAALLEAECAQCWGPVHSSALDRLPEGEV